MSNVIAYSGALIIEIIRFIGKISILMGQTCYWLFVPPFSTKRFFVQAKKIGPDSVFITILVGFFVGVIMSLQMAYQLVDLSAEIYIPSIVAVSLCRELAPVLTALVVAGRIGAGITAEIGTMQVTEQIDALRAFAVNPVKYLVVPRFLALVIMLPTLTIFADLIGILGGFVICIFKLDISTSLFWDRVTEALVIKDIATGLIKSVFFGMIIALVGCHQGLSVRGGAEGVGRSTTLSVVMSFILIIVTDCLFTVMFYFVFNA
jgi:phospholipid/cholesterol/gamma-HCH transport system permease protein